MSDRRRSRASALVVSLTGLVLLLNVSGAVNSMGSVGSPAVAVPAARSLAAHDADLSLDAGDRTALGVATSQTASAAASASGMSAAPSTASASKTAAAPGSVSQQSAGQPPVTTRKTSTSSAAPGSSAVPSYSGWTADWVENFTTPLSQTGWTAYGWGGQAPGNGGMGTYQVSNAFTSNGALTLRTQYANGQWSSAGLSSGDFYAAAGGRWEVRAKFPVAKGIGYVFLLYPDDGSWPPEVDLAEGRVNGPQVMATYHWGSANNQDHQYLTNSSMSAWHTYGVIIGTSTITYTFDGKPWATISNSSVTTKKLWIGFQCAAMDPNGSAKAYETVDNGVPGPLTPALSDIQIDWVAHYAAA